MQEMERRELDEKTSAGGNYWGMYAVAGKLLCYAVFAN